MNVLITGGSGFVGSHIADRLLAGGHNVLVIDNFSTGRRDNLLQHENLTVVEGTIADANLVKKVFDDFVPNVVVHAAASYKDPDAWQEDIMTNAIGTINVVNSSKEKSVNRFIYFQTALCYGLKPIEQPITLTHPLYSGRYEGGSSYAISKTAGEQYIELSGLNFQSFRLANAYGPRNISGPLPTFFQRLTNDKKCFVMDTRRDFIYIKDLVDVIDKSIQGVGDKGYYHISTGADYSIKELYDATLKALDMPMDNVEVRERGEDDVFTILIDPDKTQKTFSWKASKPLEDGIKETVGYYREFGIQQTFTHLKQVEE